MATISKYQTASGATLYRVRYRTPDHRQTDKRGFTTKRDAEAFAVEMEGRKLRGEYVSPTLGRATIGDLGPDWLERQKGHLKTNSYRSLETSWRVHVQPKWERTPISKVMFTDVQAWISAMGQRRGAKTVRAAHAVLAGILEDAVRDRRIASNPARGVKLPAIAKTPNKYLSADQLHMLARESGRYCSLILLLGTGGLRWGEAAGLRVKDVDFLRRRVQVHVNATAGEETTLKGGEHRTLVLAQYVIEELSVTVAGKSREDLIWPSKTGGYLKSPSSHDCWLAGAVSRCQKLDDSFPRITAHDLRHTAASLAVSAGANVKALQRMLGHKSAAMTLDVYTDLFDDDLTALAEKLDETVGKVWARGGHGTPGQGIEKAPTSTGVL